MASLSASHQAPPASFTLSSEKIKNAIRRARDCDGGPVTVAYEAVRQQRRDGWPDAEHFDDPDDYREACRAAEYEAAEQALAARGHDPTTPQTQSIIWDAMDNAPSPGMHWDSWEGHELRALNAPDLFAVLPPDESSVVRAPHRSYLMARLPAIRRGHAPRLATNTRTKGSGRGSGSSPPKSGEDDPEPPGPRSWGPSKLDPAALAGVVL